MSIAVFKLLLAAVMAALVLAGCTYWLAGERPDSASDDGSAVLRSIAFYYGDKPDWAVLEKYQMAVLEPEHGFDIRQHSETEWLAYVSVGETLESRAYYTQIPERLVLGKNRVWHSMVMDVAQPEWADFLLEHVFRPIVEQGYQGFFLDTLDSYQLIQENTAQAANSRAGLQQLIHRLKREWPDHYIILNRGFELFPEVTDDVFALAFESLYQGWDEAAGEYVDVPASDRQWLLAQVNHARQARKIPVIAIDYCDPAQPACTLSAVRKIRAHGWVPFVADGGLVQLNSLSAMP